MSSIQGLMFQPVPNFIDSVIGSTLSTAGITTVSIPAHVDNDLIIAFGSNRSNTPPPVPAGYTSIATGVCNPGGGGNRATILVYKFSDGSAQTLTFDSPNGTASADPYSGCFIFRNATGVDGNAGISSNSTGTTLAVPTIALARYPSILAAFSFFCDTSIGITAAPAGWIVENGMAYAEYQNTWDGGNFTLNTTSALIGSVVAVY